MEERGRGAARPDVQGTRPATQRVQARSFG